MNNLEKLESSQDIQPDSNADIKKADLIDEASKIDSLAKSDILDYEVTKNINLATKKVGVQEYIKIDLDEMPENTLSAVKRSVKLSLGLDLFKGLGLTIKEFFSKPVTVNYPLEMQPLSPRYRAVHNLQRMLESGNERCIGCGLCEKICTSNCIRILTSHEDTGRKKIDSYTINLGRCIYCGLCAEVCPELAIVMGNRFENSSEQRAHFGLKEDFLKDLEEAKVGNQLEFEGFGSITKNADMNIKQTPTGHM